MRFNVAVDGVVVEGCEVVDVALMDFGIIVLEVNFFLGSAFV